MFRSILKFLLQCFCTLLAWLWGVPVRPVVLMYHSFDSTGWRYGLDPRSLDRQIQHLLKKRHIVPLRKIVDMLCGTAPWSENDIAITIDDGYLDTYEVFFPLAKKYKIPFTLFLTTDLSLKPQLGNLPRPTWDMIREMADSGLVTFGLHGHNHTHFTTVLDTGLIDQEINHSIDLMKSRLQREVPYVAYPSGKYNKKVLDLMRSMSDIQAGFTARPGFITPETNLLEIPRLESHRRIPHFLFMVRLTRGFPLYQRLINSFKRFHVPSR